MKSPPNWLAQQRAQTCARCEDKRTCPRALYILESDPQCPRGLLPNVLDAIAARAWPEGVDAVSGCCDPILVGAP
jgi:hypothetical protein